MNALCQLTLSSIALLLVVSCVLEAGNPPTAEMVTNRIVSGPRPFEVTDVAFDPEGKRLLASYYMHPMNRPGTDWLAWAVDWDLRTGKPTVLPGLTGPMAFSPDGKLRVLGKVPNKRRSGWSRPPATLVVQERFDDAWKTQEAAEADNTAGADQRQGDGIVDVVFLDDGRLAVLKENGALSVQSFHKKESAKEIPSDLKQVIPISYSLSGARLEVDAKGKTLKLAVPSLRAKNTFVVTWETDPERATYKQIGTETRGGVFAQGVASSDGKRTAVADRAVVTISSDKSEVLQRLDLKIALSEK